MDIIIGAGITGLTYANFAKNKYLILEAEDHTGGLCNTIFQDGYVWDYSGHFFHFQDEKIAHFISERIDSDGLVNVEKRTQIKYKDKLVDFPFQKNIHQLDKQEFIDCLCDLFEKRDHKPATFKEMLYSKFGKSIAEKFLIPYNEKLYATDLNNLDTDAMGRFFPYANKEEIIHNFRKANNNSYNGSFLYHKEGAIKYIRALERDIPSCLISTNEAVVSIDLKHHTLNTKQRSLMYDNIISTIPLVNLLSLCGIEYNRNVLSWNKVLVFNLGFDVDSTDKRNHWIYFPEKKYCFYRVGFYSNITLSARMSLYVEIGFAHNAIIDEQIMLTKVLSDLKEAGIITNQKLISYHSIVMNPAYVHISQAGMVEVIKQKKVLSNHNVFSIGRYGSWNYSSIEDNMKEAIALSDSLAKYE